MGWGGTATCWCSINTDLASGNAAGAPSSRRTARATQPAPGTLRLRGLPGGHPRFPWLTKREGSAVAVPAAALPPHPIPPHRGCGFSLPRSRGAGAGRAGPALRCPRAAPSPLHNIAPAPRDGPRAAAAAHGRIACPPATPRTPPRRAAGRPPGPPPPPLSTAAGAEPREPRGRGRPAPQLRRGPTCPRRAPAAAAAAPNVGHQNSGRPRASRVRAARRPGPPPRRYYAMRASPPRAANERARRAERKHSAHMARPAGPCEAARGRPGHQRGRGRAAPPPAALPPPCRAPADPRPHPRALPAPRDHPAQLPPAAAGLAYPR